MGIAFEIQHRVDDVFEHARAGQIAFLGDVADHDDRGARLLGDARELRRALAHLRDRAGRRGQRFGIDRLDRVDHGDIGPLAVDGRLDFFELDFREQSQLARLRARLEQRSRCARNAICAADSSPLI